MGMTTNLHCLRNAPGGSHNGGDGVASARSTTTILSESMDCDDEGSDEKWKSREIPSIRFDSEGKRPNRPLIKWKCS